MNYIISALQTDPIVQARTPIGSYYTCVDLSNSGPGVGLTVALATSSHPFHHFSRLLRSLFGMEPYIFSRHFRKDSW